MRIAVAINEKGEWSAVGSNIWKPENAAKMALSNLDCSKHVDMIGPFLESVHFVEVEIPVPVIQSETIQGEVINA